MNSHAQVPTALVLEDRIRVYVSSRPKAGLSLTGYVDLDIAAPDKVIGISREAHPRSRRSRLLRRAWRHAVRRGPGRASRAPLLQRLEPARRCRALPQYDRPRGQRGWRRLPLSANVQGPVLDRSPGEPFSATSPCVVQHEGTWHTFYSSGLGWLEIDGKWEHIYDLRHACSADGINWQRTPQPALPQTFAEEALTRPTILRRDDGRWDMWFSHRGSRNFRSDGDAYRIGFARSSDLWTWQRDDGAAGIDVSEAGFDSEMIAYPCVIRVGSRILMFYNGNGFGRDGFAWAEWSEG